MDKFFNFKDINWQCIKEPHVYNIQCNSQIKKCLSTNISEIKIFSKLIIISLALIIGIFQTS